MGAKANFDFNKYQLNQEQSAARAHRTHASQERDSDTVVELEDGKASQLVLDSAVDSVPQIAKNIDGQTTLRTYC